MLTKPSSLQELAQEDYLGHLQKISRRAVGASKTHSARAHRRNVRARRSPDRRRRRACVAPNAGRPAKNRIYLHSLQVNLSQSTKTMGSAASTSAKPTKDVVLAKPNLRHERAAVLRLRSAHRQKWATPMLGEPRRASQLRHSSSSKKRASRRGVCMHTSDVHFQRARMEGSSVESALPDAPMIPAAGAKSVHADNVFSFTRAAPRRANSLAKWPQPVHAVVGLLGPPAGARLC